MLKSVLIPLCVFIQTLSGEKTGIHFIDSLVMKVCHIKRANQHRVFKGETKSLPCINFSLNWKSLDHAVIFLND
ncbi:MAG: hypothetical protein JSR33_05365 [Proteobacteria bacterium]|nr:hypothetical protein [Pseudomonadota bacterium]